MEITWMRHGETEWNRQRRIQGRQDIPLAPTGRQQIIDLIAEWERIDRHWEAVVTSPLQRAFISGKIIADWLHIPLRIDDAFIERGFGILEGLCKDEWEPITQGQLPENLDGVNFGVETFSKMQQRLLAGIHKLQTKHANDRVLIVTHGSVIRYLSNWWEEPLKTIGNAKWIEFKGDKANAYLYTRR